MKILVTFALETEFAPWRALHRFRRAVWGQQDTYSAGIGGAEVVVVLLGVGPKIAALRLADILRSGQDSIGICISSGVAGALKPVYPIGEVLAAKSVQSELAPENGSAPLLESSGALVSFAAECGATVVERFYTAPRVIRTAAEKRHLGNMADAVDMESFAILKEAADSGVAAVAIRSISDLAEEDLGIDFNQVLTSEGSVSRPRILWQLVRHPNALPKLVKLGRHTKRAAQSLASFLDRYVETVAGRAQNLHGRAVA
jgi:adenosylhomocysteine nucleosidase